MQVRAFPDAEAHVLETRKPGERYRRTGVVRVAAKSGSSSSAMQMACMDIFGVDRLPRSLQMSMFPPGRLDRGATLQPFETIQIERIVLRL
ncbi:hypothetical protein FB548_3702 [Pseudoxanthomonas sp. 3HH-4]|uniref:hypothetical protein n=1 Tax=Pseudoxanthomonas sp. 3HH-4 TaxID=1690214 RepID=UPI0011541B60|nr:hypothetical protein [Pseudoxanthomonas sp. 3HH-4]TQM03736.1 hypothetical protein FB548_3702 [Pseudoxanthomonas sp. 3HH-4]